MTRSTAAEEMASLKATLEGLQELVTAQQQKIDALESQENSNQREAGPRNSNPLSALKSPPIPVFTGKSTDCSSMKIKAFISSVSRVARLSNNYDELKIVQLAVCHFQDRASTWITRLENTASRPTTIDELKEAMIKEFVPSNEKAKAQLKLLTFKMRNNLEKHIEDFTDLIETCDTPTSEAYSFFFMSLPQYLEGKLSEAFPESDPDDIREVFKCARKFEMAENWATGKQDYPTEKKQSKFLGKQTVPHNASLKDKKSTRTLDDSEPSWGPAQKGEGKIYREKDRCCKCGKTPWTSTCRINPCTNYLKKAQKN